MLNCFKVFLHFLQADPTKKAQFDRQKWSLHWVFLSNTSLKPAKVESTPLPQWYYSFLIKKFLSPQARRTSQQTTLEAISRDIERGLTCCKDQYFQEKFDPCLAGAKYFF
jgi:hypothetical protein